MSMPTIDRAVTSWLTLRVPRRAPPKNAGVDILITSGLGEWPPRTRDRAFMRSTNSPQVELTVSHDSDMRFA